MKNKLLIGKILLTIILTFTLMSIANAQMVGQKNWAGVLGSSYNDEAWAIAAADSMVYVTGNTMDAVDFAGGLNNSYNPANDGSSAFVSKFGADGSYMWSTIIGGDYGDTKGFGIAADAAGNSYVIGDTNDGLNVADGVTNTYGDAELNFDLGITDVFIIKLDSNGEKVWTTVLASSEAAADYGSGIAVDGAGNVYVTGDTSDGVAFTGTPNHIIGELGYPSFFVTKLNSAGVKQWTTVIGSTEFDADLGYSVKVDGAGNVIVAGTTTNATYFAGGSNNIYGVPTGEGDGDIVIIKLDSTGDKIWATAISSFYTDEAISVVVDASGIYATGSTGYAETFGAPNHAPDNTYGLTSSENGEDDMWASKLDPTTGTLLWTTILGSNAIGDDIGNSISYGNNVNGIPGVYVVGNTNRPGFAGGPNNTYGEAGSWMAAAELNPSDGTLVWSSVIGTLLSEQTQEAYGSDFKNGHLYIAGTTSYGLEFAGGPQFTVGSCDGGTDVAMGDMYPIGYWIINPQTGISFELSNGTNVSHDGQTGFHTIYVNNTTSNKIVGLLDINFTASNNQITLPSLTAVSDAVAGKAVFHNGSAYPSYVITKWLLVPKLGSEYTPFHCPLATSLADVSTSCDSVDMSPSYTEVSIDGQTYFNMSNQGGGNGGGETVPEFSDYAMFAILVVTAGGFFAMRRKSAL